MLKTTSIAPFKIDGVYCRLIPLSQGQHAIVDADDYEWVSQWGWWAKRHGKGYYAVRVDFPSPGVRIDNVKMHCQIHPPLEGMETDHFNRVGLDNRRKNLRDATRSQQAQNRSLHRSNTSGYKGVHWAKNLSKWAARISVNGKRVVLGYFDDKFLAAMAYDAAAIVNYGEFAQLNFTASVQSAHAFPSSESSPQ